MEWHIIAYEVNDNSTKGPSTADKEIEMTSILSNPVYDMFHGDDIVPNCLHDWIVHPLNRCMTCRIFDSKALPIERMSNEILKTI
jgi:hypothetical protein